MTDEDFARFRTAFDRLCAAFRVRLKPPEATDLCRTYFAILEAHPLAEVLQAGKACLAQSKTFPRPAQWLAAVTPQETPRLPRDTRAMTASELLELTEAEDLRYTRPPCACASCYLAGVDDRDLRFVPTLVDGLEDYAFHPTRQTRTAVGHWAHGEELLRWYTARAAFFACVPPRMRGLVRPVRALVTAGRDPGEEG